VLNNSKIVTSNQDGIHTDLVKIIGRYSHDEYKRPIASFSHDAFISIKNWVKDAGGKSLVLDMGCGTGESSLQLAKKYPEHLVIGIDKSLSRIERKNAFKSDLPPNLKLVRGELLDLWYLFAKAVREKEIVVHKQYILYPNPWPKKKLVKLRFHANPIIPFILQCSKQIELRTNWKIYADEFKFVCENLTQSNVVLEKFKADIPLSNFESKYNKTGHDLYRVLLVD